MFFFYFAVDHRGQNIVRRSNRRGDKDLRSERDRSLWSLRDFIESIGSNDKKMAACLPRLPFSYVIVIVNCNSVDEWTSILASIRSNDSVDIDSVRFVRLIEFIDWNTNFGIYIRFWSSRNKQIIVIVKFKIGKLILFQTFTFIDFFIHV